MLLLVLCLCLAIFGFWRWNVISRGVAVFSTLVLELSSFGVCFLPSFNCSAIKCEGGISNKIIIGVSP